MVTAQLLAGHELGDLLWGFAAAATALWAWCWWTSPTYRQIRATARRQRQLRRWAVQADRARTRRVLP